jgi:hypothetical protein
MSFLGRIRQRKIVQAAIGYSAASWVIVQVLQFLADTYRWPPAVLRAVPGLLITGLFVLLVLSWFHGERGQQRVSIMEATILSVLLITGLSGAWVLGKGAGKKHALPLVLMMDSPYHERVYDEETARNNGTNADVISDILLDLPVRRQKEAIGPVWHRDEEMTQFGPDLVIIHLSAFCRESPCTAAVERLRQFIEYFGEVDTQFLIYSRGLPPWGSSCAADRSCERHLRATVDSVLAKDYREYRTLKSRITVFGIRDYGEPYWRDPLVANAFKLRVRKLLDIT